MLEDMNILPLPGRLETTVWLIDGGGASVRLEFILIPELLRRSDWFVVEFTVWEILLKKHPSVPPFDELPTGQGLQVESLILYP